MQKATLSSVGSIVAAVTASLCCIGPAVLAILGASSLGAFAAFETYRPFFIGLTVVLLGLAFYLTYRKREVVCEDGSCKIEAAGKWNKILLWLAALLALIFLFFPQILTLL